MIYDSVDKHQVRQGKSSENYNQMNAFSFTKFSTVGHSLPRFHIIPWRDLELQLMEEILKLVYQDLPQTPLLGIYQVCISR